MSELQDKLHAAATLFIAAKAERDHAEVRMASHKRTVEKLMIEAGEQEVILPYDEAKNIKIKSAIRSTKKFDKEQVAEDLDVAVDSVKQDFLVKSVEDGKLTYGQYKGYYYREEKDNTSIRTVKAD